MSVFASLTGLLTKQTEAQLLTRCSLLVEIYSMLINRCKRTRYSLQKLLVAKIRSLLVAEVARCKNSLVTRFRSCSLQKISHYLLQKLLVAKNQSLLVAKFARYFYQMSLVPKNCSPLAMKKPRKLMFI